MDTRVKPYTIVRISCLVCAVGATILAWRYIPITGNPWPDVVWFTIAAAAAELLILGMGEDNNVGVTPSSLIYWSSVCVLGPLPSVVVCVGSAVMADVIASSSYHLAGRVDGRPLFRHTPVGRIVLRALRRAGTIWELRTNEDLVTSLKTTSQYAAALVLAAVPAGAAYYLLGGQFLVETGPQFNAVANFILPFLGLIVVSLAAEHGMHQIVMAAIDPVPGARGLYGALLRMKLALIENSLPVCKGQLFLVVVALLVSYLYANIGPWGFVVATMPLIALRDFFYQWVEERNAYLNTITTLATYMQHYHPYTRGHLKRVADLSERLARELKLPAESVRFIRPAAFLHDIGKIGVSEEILDKTGKLDDDEWSVIKEHPVKGAQIVGHIEFLEGIVDWIKYHHKWYDGSGYPDTNGNGAIPIEAAIIATADSFDAMTDDRELAVQWKCDSCGFSPPNGDRPSECPSCGALKRRTYREPKTLDQAVDELRRGAGGQFHPAVVKAFLTMVERDGIHLNV